MTEAKPRYFIPATPGYQALVITPTDSTAEGYEMHRRPILAWELRLDGNESHAVPITMDEPDAYTRDCAVLSPEGRVIRSNLETYDSEEAWLARYTARGLMKKIEAEGTRR